MEREGEERRERKRGNSVSMCECVNTHLSVKVANFSSLRETPKSKPSVKDDVGEPNAALNLASSSCLGIGGCVVYNNKIHRVHRCTCVYSYTCIYTRTHV